MSLFKRELSEKWERIPMRCGIGWLNALKWLDKKSLGNLEEADIQTVIKAKKWQQSSNLKILRGIKRLERKVNNL